MKHEHSPHEEPGDEGDVVAAPAVETGAGGTPAAAAAAGLGLPTAGVLAATAAALAACGGGNEAATADAATGSAQALAAGRERGVAPAPADGAPPISGFDASAELARFLLQAQFSAPDADMEFVRTQGFAAWLTAQFNAPQSQSGFDWLIASGNADPFRGEFFNPSPADFMVWRQLVASPDQMRKRMALALSEMFVVSTGSMDAFWPGSFMAAYWDLLVKNAFGNFRTLLEDVTLNAAMGRYLNTLGNQKEDPATGRQPDENYAREIMQLFTIGLLQLNLDGTPKLDSSGRPIETYVQSDVSNLARVFTGYDYDFTGVSFVNTQFQPYPIPTHEFARNRMAFDASKHSNLSATFLGTTIPANTAGPVALRIALDTLFNHPNVGPFFARQMIQRLVTSNPTPAYVQRVASAFNNNGAGVRGDMKAVWRAILLDSEARQLPKTVYGGKVREPMIRAVQWARTFNATSVSGNWIIYNQSPVDWGLSQSPLQSPSVFNFFRPGYVPPRTAIATAGLVAPEFQLHSESSTVGYLNYLTNWVEGKFGYADDLVADYSPLLPLAHDARALLSWLNLRLTANQLSDRSFKLIYASLVSVPVTAASPNDLKLNRIYAAILLVMACPEYIVQK